jgi:hypothetical protein
MQVNMQLIDLGIASDFKGCMLDIKIKKGCTLDILKVLGCMLDICRYIHDSQPCISSEEVGGEAGIGGW